MRQVLPRAFYLLRHPAVLLALLGVSGGGTALVLLPLFGVPGYELGEAVALLIGLLGGLIGIAAAVQERRLIQGRDPRPPKAARQDGAFASTRLATLAAVLLTGLAVLPPLVAGVVYAWTSSRCDPFAQVGFYPLLAVPSALVAACAGAFCGFATSRWVASVGLYACLVLASGAVTAWPIYFGPQVYAYNHFLGFFPGPLYDEALRVGPGLGVYRVETGLLALGLLLLTTALLDMKTGGLGRPRLRPLVWLSLAATIAGGVLIEERAPALGLRMTQGYLEERLGGVKETEHFHLVYPRGKSREDVDRLVRDLEFRYQQDAAFLGLSDRKQRVNAFVYRTPQEKAALVGAAHTQYAKPWRRELHLNDAPFPHPSVKHELMHVLAADYGTGWFKVTSRMGVFPVMGIVEGIAVAGDNPVTDLTLHEWAAGMRREKLAPDIRALLNPQGFYASAAQRAYLYAGSFIRYLADTYGQEKLQRLYAHGDVATAYGRNLDGLATEWEKMLDQLPLEPSAVNEAFARFRQGSIFARACAREVANLKEAADDYLHSDPDKALELLQRCSKLQPDEPAYGLAQARALAALERRPEARSLLLTLAAQVEKQPALAAEVKLALADLEVQAQHPELAVQHLNEVIALHTAAAVDRTARVKLAALSGSPATGAAIWSYFQTDADDVKLLKLREALATDPRNPYLAYLLGRRLAQGHAPVLAVGYLAQALAAELPTSVRREALRLKVEADFMAGDCAAVKDEVGRLPDLGAAFKAGAREWVERCDFELTTFKSPLVPPAPFR